jgi:phage shock protein A
MQNNEMDAQEAERIATEALSKKENHANEAVRLAQEAERHEQMANKLQSNISKIKSSVTTYENDLITLKARAKTAASTKKINAQLAQVDPSGTIAMLEKMKAKVEEDESLSQAYGEIASADRSVDDEINAALESGQKVAASDSLLELKKKMGIT